MSEVEPLVIRTANEADLRFVLALEARCETAAHWAESEYRKIFECSSPPRILLVADANGDIVGFVLGLAVCDEWELENIAVAPELRGRGIGRWLTVSLLEKAQQNGAKSIFLEVRTSNLPARKLYEHCGFRQIGQRTGYYQNPLEDAVLYRFLCNSELLESI